MRYSLILVAVAKPIAAAMNPYHDRQWFLGFALGHIHIEEQAILRADNFEAKRITLMRDIAFLAAVQFVLFKSLQRHRTLCNRLDNE